jgi:UDP-GlcNAc:undecaprenyl-phosphate GlcNAc-1-phosphate transferase
VPLAYVVAAAFVVGGALCALAAGVARKGLRGRLGGVEPGIEKRPPRLGGLAALAATAGIAWAGGYVVPADWAALVPWILAMYGVGFLDDAFDLPPRLKFLLQAVICLAATAHVSFSPIATPDGAGLDLGTLAVPATAFWLLLVVNAVNFMDGADGLAGGFVVIVASAIALLALGRGHPDLAALLSIWAGAHAGFLLLNWHPARLYLGDAGSLGAGFVLALAGIRGTNAAGATVGLHTNALLFWLPLTEMALTVGRRFVRGQPLAHGDDRHIHHMLVESGRRKEHAVGVLLGLAALTGLAAVASARWRSVPVALLIAGLVATTAIGVQALGYVEFRVVTDRLRRFLRLTKRRTHVLVSVAEAAQRIRRAASWVELQAALRTLVDGGILDEADLVPREPRRAPTPGHAWTLEGDVGPAENPGYTLVVRSSEDERFAVRPEDVKAYVLPALEAAVERLGVAPAGSVAEKRGSP